MKNDNNKFVTFYKELAIIEFHILYFDHLASTANNFGYWEKHSNDTNENTKLYMLKNDKKPDILVKIITIYIQCHNSSLPYKHCYDLFAIVLWTNMLIQNVNWIFTRFKCQKRVYKIPVL